MEINNEQSLEELFQELDALMQQMEQPENSLEEAFATYQKGLGLLKQCNDKIDQIEKQVIMLDEGGEEHDF